MKAAGVLVTLALLGASPTPGEDAAVLRAVLAQVGARDGYCVTAALEEPPFAAYRRDAARYTGDGDQAAALRDRVGYGWSDFAMKPLDPALTARIVTAGTTLAARGDPAPLPPEPVAEMNVMAAADVPVGPADATSHTLALADQLEAAADAADAVQASPDARDHGRVDAAWLARRQRLAERCDYPSASVSAVAREGDLAFVAVGLVWAPLAGIGEEWVLQRTASGWRPVARRRTWIA